MSKLAMVSDFIGYTSPTDFLARWAVGKPLESGWATCDRPYFMTELLEINQGLPGWPDEQTVRLLNADIAELVLPIWERSHHRDYTLSSAIREYRLFANGDIDQRAWHEVKMSVATAHRNERFFIAKNAACAVLSIEHWYCVRTVARVITGISFEAKKIAEAHQMICNMIRKKIPMVGITTKFKAAA